MFTVTSSSQKKRKRAVSHLPKASLRVRVKGFTLIELLVVFTVIAIIASASVASFVSYSRSAAMQQAASDVAGLIRDAKARTQSQVKPAGCTGNLVGYQVDICGLTGSACSTENTYRLARRCSNGTTVVATRSLPENISFTNSGTTSVSFFFQVVSNGVVGAGDVVLSGFNTTKVITVGQPGTITIQ